MAAAAEANLKASLKGDPIETAAAEMVARTKREAESKEGRGAPAGTGEGEAGARAAEVRRGGLFTCDVYFVCCCVGFFVHCAT
eukprot:856094-Prorocentrum_minimum.AAC.1